MKTGKLSFSKLCTVLVFVFLYAPIFVLIANSFNESKSRAVWTGFTFDWYEKLFHNEMILSSLLNSLIVALVAAVVATVLGTAAAIGIHNMNSVLRRFIMSVTNLPNINPEIVTGVSLMLLFVGINMEFGFTTLILSHIVFCVPYVILNVMPKLRQMNTSLCEAAMDLGCNQWQMFRKVVIPEITPGIITGFLMAFTYSIDDFVISYFTYGAKAQTLSITIFSMTRRKVSPEVNALSTIIFVVVLAVLLIVNIIDIKKHKKGANR